MHLCRYQLGLPLHRESLLLQRRKVERLTLLTPRCFEFGLQQMKPLGQGRLAFRARALEDLFSRSEEQHPSSERQYSPMCKQELRARVPFGQRH